MQAVVVAAKTLRLNSLQKLSQQQDGEDSFVHQWVELLFNLRAILFIPASPAALVQLPVPVVTAGLEI